MRTERPRPAPVVGKKIRQLRKDRKLTQAELASRMGIQQSDLCRMETGEYKVSLEALFKILRIFELNISDFFREEMEPASLSVGKDVELLQKFRRLSPQRQDEVLDFVNYKLYQTERGEEKN
ncbi:MAG: helix-turn-helix transcriptional regulator [Acidobacteriota bacterium]